MPQIKNNNVKEFINKHSGLFNLINHEASLVRCLISNNNNNTTDINIEIEYKNLNINKKLIDSKIIKNYFKKHDDDTWVSTNFSIRTNDNSIDIYKTIQNE